MFGMLRQYLRYTSWPIITAMIALMAIGVMAISVSEQAEAGGQAAALGYAHKQVVFGGVALGAFLLATIIPYQRIGRYAYLMFAVTILLLVALFFLPMIKNTHRWVRVGSLLVQPSEIAKLTFIILLAWYLRSGNHYRRLRGLVLPFVLTFVPMILILKEPDLGTSMLFLPTLYFMLFMAGAKLRHLLGVIGVATALLLVPVPQKVSPKWDRSEADCRASLAYWKFQKDGQPYYLTAACLAKMEPHQISRVAGWLRQNDPKYVMGNCYQLHQSKIIIGSGGLGGRSDWTEVDAYFRTLPEDHTDFIFSVLGGQWGFLGCAGVFFLYLVIFVLGVEIAAITYDPFGRLLAVGVLALLFTQLVINVGMTMGLMPVTGMTLPLISYGGSSLVINCFALGLLINIGQRRPILLGKHPFEHGDRRERSPALPTMADRMSEK